MVRRGAGLDDLFVRALVASVLTVVTAACASGSREYEAGSSSGGGAGGDTSVSSTATTSSGLGGDTAGSGGDSSASATTGTGGQGVGGASSSSSVASSSASSSFASSSSAASSSSGGDPTCNVFETSVVCMAGWTVVYVSSMGSNGGNFTFATNDPCLPSITDVNCNTSSSVGTSCPVVGQTMTVTHTPCDNTPPCATAFVVQCP